MAEQKIKRAWYKRWWAITIFIIIALAILGGILGGDNHSQSTNDNSGQSQITSEKQEAKTYSVGDSVQAGDFKWKIVKFSTAKSIGSNPYLTTEASGIYLILDVEVENTGKSAEYLMDSYLKLVDEQGREFSPDTSVAFYLPNFSLKNNHYIFL